MALMACSSLIGSLAIFMFHGIFCSFSDTLTNQLVRRIQRPRIVGNKLDVLPSDTCSCKYLFARAWSRTTESLCSAMLLQWDTHQSVGVLMRLSKLQEMHSALWTTLKHIASQSLVEPCPTPTALFCSKLYLIIPSHVSFPGVYLFLRDALRGGP